MAFTAFNPCTYHDDAPAVASCGVCGKTMCRRCVDVSTYTYENKPMCKDCTAKLLSESIEEYKKEISWSQIKLGFLIVFLVIGAIIFITNPENKMLGWIIAGIGGIPSVAKSAFQKSPEERAMDHFMVRTNAEDGCLQMAVMFVVRLALTLLFAPIAAIFFCIKNWTNLNKCKSALEKEEAAYNRLMSSGHDTTGGHQHGRSQEGTYSSNARQAEQRQYNPHQQQQAQQPSRQYQQAPQQMHSAKREDTMFASVADYQTKACLVFNGIRYPLAVGNNIVGRKASSSPATVQIPTDDLYMSRQHCIIHVSSDGKVTIANYQNKNRTAVNGRILNGNMPEGLTDGCQITLGHTNIIYHA